MTSPIKLRIHIPVAGPEKFPLLWSCLSALYSSNLPSWVSIKVVLNYDGPMSETMYPNDRTGFKVWHTLLPDFQLDVQPDLSVPAMYVAAAESALLDGCTHLMKIDDDCLVHNFRAYLDWLAVNAEVEWTAINFWDVENGRKYDDWYSEYPISHLYPLIAKHGDRTVSVQRWRSDKLEVFPYHKSSSVVNPAFTIRLDKLMSRPDILEVLRTTKRGVRGNLDWMLGNVCETRLQILTSWVVHLGVYRPQLDGKYWTGYVGDKNLLPWSEAQT